MKYIMSEKVNIKSIPPIKCASLMVCYECPCVLYMVAYLY